MTAIIAPGKLHYNTIDAHDTLVKEQLYALLDANLIDFEPKLGRPTKDELVSYFMRPKGPKKVEPEYVRTIETGPVGTGGDDDADSSGGGVSDETEDASTEGSEVAERWDGPNKTGSFRRKSKKQK